MNGEGLQPRATELPKGAEHPNQSGRLPRVAILSYAFLPSKGGIEYVSSMLATGLQQRGWEVLVITQTPGPAEKGVLRQPSITALRRALSWADVAVASNPSLRLTWPLVTHLLDTPWIAVAHTPIRPPNQSHRRLRDRIKAFAMPRGNTFAVSEWLLQHDNLSGQVLPNPYDDTTFTAPNRPPEQDLLFVGRLVSAKGVDVLLEALSLMPSAPRLTIVGDGYERQRLELQAKDLGVSVHFLGSQSSAEIATLMRDHRVLAIPSRTNPPEAFGIVAIEGLASGCSVVASDSGGLPEAVGGHGRIVPVEDPRALAHALAEALGEARPDMSKRIGHLSQYRTEAFLGAYEAAICAAAEPRLARATAKASTIN